MIMNAEGGHGNEMGWSELEEIKFQASALLFPIALHILDLVLSLLFTR